MLDLLLPRRCAVCAAAGTALCPGCATALPAAPDRPPPPGLDACWALLAYRGRTRDLVAALKYRNHRDALRTVGPALAELLVDAAPSLPGPVTLTWAPTSAGRRRRRGYDQAELLARAVASPLHLRPRRLLRRRPGPAQTGRHRDERLHGPAFRSSPVGGTVVVVDDVWTTGATLSAAAGALRSAGATCVAGLTLAVRP